MFQTSAGQTNDPPLPRTSFFFMEKTKLVCSDRAEGSMPCNTIVSSTTFYLAKVKVFFLLLGTLPVIYKIMYETYYFDPPPPLRFWC